MNDVDEYQQLALRTAPKKYKPLTKKQMDLVHAVLGLTTEVGELATVIKNHVIYGKPLDSLNLEEEAGDLEWYVALLHDAIGFAMSMTLERNIGKLRKRYPDGFSERDALARADKADSTAVGFVRCDACSRITNGPTSVSTDAQTMLLCGTCVRMLKAMSCPCDGKPLTVNTYDTALGGPGSLHCHGCKRTFYVDAALARAGGIAAVTTPPVWKCKSSSCTTPNQPRALWSDMCVVCHEARLKVTD